MALPSASPTADATRSGDVLPGDVLPGDAPSAEPEACPNCGAGRAGAFCHGCGQRLDRGRLTTRGLVGDAVSTLFSADFRLWRTLVDLTLRPGHAIRAYLDGRRRCYTNPFAFVALGSALYVLVFSWLGGFEMIDAAMTEQAGESFANMSEAEQRIVLDVMDGITRSMLLTTLATVAPFAGLMWFLMRGPTLNFAEASVFSLYTLGHPIYLSLPVTVAMLALGVSLNVQSAVAILIYFAVIAVSSYQFLGRSLAKALLLVGLYVLVFMGFMLTAGLAVGLYLAITG